MKITNQPAQKQLLETVYGFDPTHGYTVNDLLQVTSPEPPKDYSLFWKKRYDKALDVKPLPQLKDTGQTKGGWRVFDVNYTSTDNFPISGWLLLPEKKEPKRAFISVHGYTNIQGPDFHLPFQDAALLFPCLRGLGLSSRPPISNETRWHVLHDIDKPDQYLLGGCVEDVWLGISALIRLFPELHSHIGYLGISFGGGIGAMSIAWDKRIKLGHLNIPTFGNHPLRMTLDQLGSGSSVKKFHDDHGDIVFDTLKYYDAATAARFVTIPMHCALAQCDPLVPPAGQFAIYNSLAGKKELFLLTAGHHQYAHELQEHTKLLAEISNFFKDL